MVKMKRLLTWTVLLVMLLPAGVSLAEGKSFIECTCIGDDCVCFIHSGDEGGAVSQIIQRLIDEKYLPKSTPKNMFTEQVESAVMKFQKDHELEITGMMDDDTLTLLLWGMLPEELDLTKGSKNDCTTVFIPTDGGKKRHRKETCSKMSDPRKVSVRNAEWLGFEPCKKCKPQ